MERKEALQYITTKLNQGIPKHIIYYELLSKVPYKEDLLAYISEIPDTETQSTLRTQNQILISILIFLLLLNVANAVVIITGAKTENVPWFILGGWAYLLVPVFLVFTINELRKFRRNGYRYVFLLTIIVINVHLLGPSHLIDWLIIVSPWLPALFLAFRIMQKTHPYDGIFKSLDRTRLEADLTHLAKNKL